MHGMDYYQIKIPKIGLRKQIEKKLPIFPFFFFGFFAIKNILGIFGW